MTLASRSSAVEKAMQMEIQKVGRWKRWRSNNGDALWKFSFLPLKAVSHANVADILGKIVVKDDGFPAINSLGEVN